MHFCKPKDFEVVRSILPTMHLTQCTGKNYECREYYKKDETKIEGYDFFEFGVLVEERQRTDITAFKEDLLNKATIPELFDKYPTLTLNSYHKILGLQQELLKEEFKNKIRDVYVCYIYGKADAGKTTYPLRVLGFRPMDICKVADYGSGKFDEYNNQDIILFDEFTGQIPLYKMNDLLDEQPLTLYARYSNKVACYTKVFIISNYPLDEQYTKERASGKQPSFEGLLRRIHEIIYMPERNVYVWEKGLPSEETIKTLNEQNAKVVISSPLSCHENNTATTQPNKDLKESEVQS